MEFKDKLKQARLDANMKIGDLAKIVEVTSRTLQYYESGDRIPSNISHIVKIAKALNVQPAYLLADLKDKSLSRAFKKTFTHSNEGLQHLVEEIAYVFLDENLTSKQKDDLFASIQKVYLQYLNPSSDYDIDYNVLAEYNKNAPRKYSYDNSSDEDNEDINEDVNDTLNDTINDETNDNKTEKD